VPYAVLPLTVIGLNMILATLPLAVLLVVMIVQSAAPSVTVDPLLAKNILWFFGHPVVYLLLFPAVAIYYVLIPRYAKRPLVAGNVVAVAWVLAVFVNLMIWAHHIYLDYPSGSHQAAIDTAMQPLTFAITIPSALSIYSLFFTVYRSDFEWTAASTALFLGIVSWLLAGLSGVVNATIAFDAVVHNTLWIVGHFHHMALLNIGFVIFGAVYALLPELTGKQLYSEALAKWHIWLTFVGGMGNQALWLVQGLEGAPRRFAVLPERFQDLGSAAVPFVALIAVAQLLFAWNLVQTLRGRVAGAAARRPRVASGHGFVASVAVGLAALAAIAGWGLARATEPSAIRVATTVQTTPPPGGVAAGDPVRGRQVYAQAGCGACHVLAAAGSTGTIGPSLDQSRPSLELVLERVRNGKGAMPAFKGRLSDQQIADVAAFVARSAGP
jgi:heme/copper-type cytochrome/quinol oxidase subunit 1